MNKILFLVGVVAAFMLVQQASANVIEKSSTWTWNPNIGLQFVYYSYAAYCPNSNVKAWNCKWCKEPQISAFTPTNFPYDPIISGYGYIGVHHPNKTVVVVFRGTDDLRGWIIDLESAEKVPYKNVPGAEVGKGFYNEWNALLPNVVPPVKNLLQQNPGYSLWVTGHSLGAAISVLCALELAEQGLGPVNVYNFGCPRVGNQNFSNYYANYVPNTYRVVNGKDVVPHVPLEDMGFYHVPTEVWENPAESMTFKVCKGGEDPTCSDSQIVDDSVYDHLHYFNVYEDCASS